MSKRVEAVLYLNDSLQSTIAQLGKTKRLRLEAQGIASVISDAEIDRIAALAKPEGVTKNDLFKFRSDALEHCREEVIPAVKDHRTADNPYLSKFGDEWELHLKQSSGMSRVCCITEYLDHIFVSSDKAFKGTTHEDDWLLFHDALSQMTAKETVEWMKQKMFKGKSYYD